VLLAPPPGRERTRQKLLMIPMQSIVILSGPVGAGKTTIASQLIANSPLPIAHIEGDKFWFFIAKGGPGVGRKKNFRTIMSAMTAAAVPYALVGYEVILDFSIPPWYLGEPTEDRRGQECAPALCRAPAQ
jgi:chloramphenicol 3-O-phosphotransferase